MFEELDKILEGEPGEAVVREKAPHLSLKDGERRVVAVLFADLKGFTALSEKFDSEEIQALMDRAMKLFSRSIMKYDGYIDKYEGDRIMALFGAKRASEQDTQRAVLTGLDMLENLEKFNDALSRLSRLQKVNIRLSIRIGINTGLVTTGRIGVEREGDFTVYGDAVNLASRMESSAPVNTIMLPIQTKQLVEDYFEFEDAGDIRVKGKSAPVTAYTVTGRKLHRRHMRDIRTRFVGREEEMALLSKKYELARSRIGQSEASLVMVGIKGEAGIGKSRLVHEFLQTLPEEPEDNLYYYGETDPYVRNPYGLFISMIRDITGSTETGSGREMKHRLDESYEKLSAYLETEEERKSFLTTRPLIGYLLGVRYDDARLETLDGKALQDQIHIALRSYIANWIGRSNARGFPCVLVLENLHWIDDASRTMLELFLNTLNIPENGNGEKTRQPFLIMIYRPDFVTSREFGRQEFTELALPPLSDISSNSLIRSMIGSSNQWTRKAEIIIDKSAGNPFFIEEWLRFITQSEEFQPGETPVPAFVNSLVLSRLDRLEKDSRLLLQKASVIGPRFTPRMLAQIEKRLGATGDITRHIENLISNGWIDMDRSWEGSYRFRHAITQEISYNTLLIRNRKILHRLIAGILEDEGELPENYMTIYTHYRQTDDTRKRIEFGVKVGDRLKEEYQNKEALRVYKEALEQLPDRAEEEEADTLRRIDILLKIADVLRTTGEWTESEQYSRKALDLSQGCSDGKRMGSAYRHLGWLLTCMGNYEEAMALLEKSYQLFEGEGDRAGLAKTLSDMGVICKNRGDYAEAMTYYGEELAICEELGDIRGISKASGNIGIVHFQKGDFEKALASYEKELRFCEEVGDIEGILRAICNIGCVYHRQGDPVRALECFRKQLSMARQIGNRKIVSDAFCNMGAVYNELGKYERARQYFRQDRDVCEELGDRRGLSIAVINLGAVYCALEEYEKALQNFLRAMELCEDLGDKPGIATTCANLGNIYLDTENHEKALVFLDRGIEIAREIEFKSILTYCLILKADTLFSLKDYDAALPPAADGLRIAKEVGMEDQVFGGLVLTAKIDHALGRKKEARTRLRDLLDRAESQEDRAILNYELYTMETERKGNSENYRKTALELYRRLNEESPCSEYRAKIGELENR